MSKAHADMELAYLAGFFDGEGNIRIAQNYKIGRSCYYLRISATQIDPAPLKILKKRFGGYLYQRPAARKQRDGCIRKQIWDWVLCGPRAAIAVKALLPHLIVKRESAKLAIAFQACIRSGKGSRRAMTDVELSERRFYFDALKVRTNHQRVGGVGAASGETR